MDIRNWNLVRAEHSLTEPQVRIAQFAAVAAGLELVVEEPEADITGVSTIGTPADVLALIAGYLAGDKAELLDVRAEGALTSAADIRGFHTRYAQRQANIKNAVAEATHQHKQNPALSEALVHDPSEVEETLAMDMWKLRRLG